SLAPRAPAATPGPRPRILPGSGAAAPASRGQAPCRRRSQAAWAGPPRSKRGAFVCRGAALPAPQAAPKLRRVDGRDNARATTATARVIRDDEDDKDTVARQGKHAGGGGLAGWIG